jgi:dTDP-4-dehydrorhamnose 3,5-epimerase-like enzyme
VIRLYSFHAVPPARLADQRGMFERFTAEQHEPVVANEGQNETDAAAMSQATAVRGLRCEPRKKKRAKRRWFTRLCDGLLTGGMTLPQTAAPAIPPWQAEAP